MSYQSCKSPQTLALNVQHRLADVAPPSRYQLSLRCPCHSNNNNSGHTHGHNSNNNNSGHTHGHNNNNNSGHTHGHNNNNNTSSYSTLKVGSSLWNLFTA